MVRVYQEGGENRVALHGSTGYVVLDSDASNPSFHKLRITVSGSMARLYIDDNSTDSLHVGLHNRHKLPLLFGDLTGAADANYDTDYFYAYDGGALAGGTDPTTWTMKYDGDYLTNSSSAILYSDGTRGSFASHGINNSSISSGLLNINTIGTDSSTSFEVPSEPSWYYYNINTSYDIQGWNTIEFDNNSTSSDISVDDLILTVSH